MGCFIVLFAMISPRLALFLTWVFNDRLSVAFTTWLWPMLGFFFLPWTTLVWTYAYAPVRGRQRPGLGGGVHRRARRPRRHRLGPPHPTGPRSRLARHRRTRWKVGHAPNHPFPSGDDTATLRVPPQEVEPP